MFCYQANTTVIAQTPAERLKFTERAGKLAWSANKMRNPIWWCRDGLRFRETYEYKARAKSFRSESPETSLSPARRPVRVFSKESYVCTRRRLQRQNGNVWRPLSYNSMAASWGHVPDVATEMHSSKVSGIFATSEFFRGIRGVNPPLCFSPFLPFLLSTAGDDARVDRPTERLLPRARLFAFRCRLWRNAQRARFLTDKPPWVFYMWKLYGDHFDLHLNLFIFC